MEYRRRTLSSLDDNDSDIENGRRRRGTSVSLDDQIDDYVDYMYTNSYNVSSSVFSAILNLICPCFRKTRSPNNSTIPVE